MSERERKILLRVPGWRAHIHVYFRTFGPVGHFDQRAPVLRPGGRLGPARIERFTLHTTFNKSGFQMTIRSCGWSSSFSDEPRTPDGHFHFHFSFPFFSLLINELQSSLPRLLLLSFPIFSSSSSAKQINCTRSNNTPQKGSKVLRLAAGLSLTHVCTQSTGSITRVSLVSEANFRSAFCGSHFTTCVCPPSLCPSPRWHYGHSNNCCVNCVGWHFIPQNLRLTGVVFDTISINEIKQTRRIRPVCTAAQMDR